MLEPSTYEKKWFMTVWVYTLQTLKNMLRKISDVGKLTVQMLPKRVGRSISHHITSHHGQPLWLTVDINNNTTTPPHHSQLSSSSSSSSSSTSSFTTNYYFFFSLGFFLCRSRETTRRLLSRANNISTAPTTPWRYPLHSYLPWYYLRSSPYRRS